MNTNANTTSASTAAPESTTENTTGSAAGADQTSQSTDAPQQERAAPGGSKSEFNFTWTLRPLTARNIAKAVLMLAGYIGLAHLMTFLIGLTAGFPIVFGIMASALAVVGMLVGTFLVIVPASIVIVDKVADLSIAGWSKVKSWFKKGEAVGEAAAAACASAAAEPAPAAA